MIVLATALGVALALNPPCRVPKHAAAIMEDFSQANGLDATLAIYDLADAKRTCEIPLPGGPSPDIQVSADGMIYAAIQPHKNTEYTTDIGHLAVFSPSGRLIHRVYAGMEGIYEIQLDQRGHLFVTADEDAYVGGVSMITPRTFTMYDAKTLRKLRTFDLGPERWFRATVSPDGKYLAVSYDTQRNAGHVDLIDPATCTLIRRISVPAESVEFEGSTLRVESQVGENLIDLPNGSPKPAPKKPEHFTETVDGITYSEGRDPFVMPGQGEQRTTFLRRRASDGVALRPLVARGIAFWPAFFSPSPTTLAATAGPETVLPKFPRAAELQRKAATARGISFDDAVRGRHYTYLGELARIDIPDKKVFVLVDCANNAAVVASPETRTYTVYSIDPPYDETLKPREEQTSAAPGVPTPAPLMWRIRSLEKSDLHAESATIGYRVEDAGNTSHATSISNELNEREYALTDGAIPSCAMRTYGGEPLPILPQRIFELSDFSTQMMQHPLFVHVDGSPPVLPPNAILVHAEGMQQDGTVKISVDIKQLHSVGAEVLSQFAIPAGYHEQPAPQF